MQETQETGVLSLGREDPLETSDPGLFAQSCLTLSWPMDCSLPDSLVHGIFQAGCWNGLPFPSPEDLPHPGIQTGSPELQTDSLPTELPGKLPPSGEGNGNPFQYPCLENPMDKGAWRVTVHGVAKSQTWLSD